jgi:hypothetical protein
MFVFISIYVCLLAFGFGFLGLSRSIEPGLGKGENEEGVEGL